MSFSISLTLLVFYAQSSNKGLAPREDIKDPARKRAGKEPEVFTINQADGF
jgi:hypothetical protein